jgi:prepilin-type N-terminal cleavage/methylation domain-containing protein
VTPIRRRLTDSSGFTLVELLVVILILGILASIGLAAFLHQRAKSEDAAAKVYATTAAKAMIVWHTDHGDYAGATGADLQQIEPSLHGASGLTLTSDATSFTIAVDSTSHTEGGGTFTLVHAADGTVHRTCSNAGKGGCAATPDSHGNSW